MSAMDWVKLGLIVLGVLSVLGSVAFWCICRAGDETQLSASEEAHLAAATERAYSIMREEAGK